MLEAFRAETLTVCSMLTVASVETLKFLFWNFFRTLLIRQIQEKMRNFFNRLILSGLRITVKQAPVRSP